MTFDAILSPNASSCWVWARRTLPLFAARANSGFSERKALARMMVDALRRSTSMMAAMSYRIGPVLHFAGADENASRLERLSESDLDAVTSTFAD